jgi:Fungal specific transcription factor domain
MEVIPLTSGEKSCFEWYRCRSVIKLPGAFRSSYWTTLLFQAYATEPAIRHAVLALASAHMEEVRGAGLMASERNDERALSTVRQYNKAITYLQPCFSDGRRISVRITLITCTLFVYMEFLRGHYTKGIAHLDHGLGLIQCIGSSVKSQDPLSAQVDGWIVATFTRLLVQVKLLGQELKSPYQSFLSSGIQSNLGLFRSIHHARHTLEHIVLRTFNLQEQIHDLTKATSAESSTTWCVLQNEIRHELEIWLAAHEATVSNLSPQSTIWEVFAYRLLRIFHRVAKILVNTCLDPLNELIFDVYESDFLGIISNSIEIYQLLSPNGEGDTKAHHDPEPSSPNSISDIAWIPPLYFTAIKCRNYRIRHQAVKLLESTPHKEGMWSGTLAVCVARQVVEVEEGNFYDHEVHEKFDMLAAPTDKDVATPVLPEEFRLSKINVILPDDRAGKLCLKCFRKRRSSVIEWISKEYDLPSRQWRDIMDHPKQIHAAHGPKLSSSNFQATLTKRTSPLSNPH